VNPPSNLEKSIPELMGDNEGIGQAMESAVYKALRTHKLLGQPIVVWRDGKVVWVPPEEIELPGEKNGKSEAR
jgi:hypothetical protein